MFIVIATVLILGAAVALVDRASVIAWAKGRPEALAGGLVVLLIILGGLLIAGSASAQQTMQHCAPRAKVIERLATKYGETRRSMGLGSNNAVMEVFASDESGSWTITVTMTNGVTCLVASGQAFEELAEALPPRGDAL